MGKCITKGISNHLSVNKRINPFSKLRKLILKLHVCRILLGFFGIFRVLTRSIMKHNSTFLSGHTCKSSAPVYLINGIHNVIMNPLSLGCYLNLGGLSWRLYSQWVRSGVLCRHLWSWNRAFPHSFPFTFTTSLFARGQK